MAATAGDVSALAFSVDLPAQFTRSGKYLDKDKSAKAKDQVSNNVSGFILGVSAGGLGMGYEKYQVGLKGEAVGGTSATFDITLDYQLYDVFLDLPLPLIHPVIGYGKGILKTNIEEGRGGKTSVKPVDGSQYFIRLGIALGPLWDVHLGYHKQTAEEAKITGSGGPPGGKFLGSGETYTLGVRLGWQQMGWQQEPARRMPDIQPGVRGIPGGGVSPTHLEQ
jgi:hypothetical protein